MADFEEIPLDTESTETVAVRFEPPAVRRGRIRIWKLDADGNPIGEPFEADDVEIRST